MTADSSENNTVLSKYGLKYSYFVRFCFKPEIVL